MKTAILIVSFGTTYEFSWKQTIGTLEKEIRQAYGKCCDVQCAYTSRKVIQSWKEKGRTLLNEEEALENLANQGYEAVIVLPTHLLAGYEYRKIKERVLSWKNRLKKIVLGTPLLVSVECREKIAQAVLEVIPFSKEESLVLMGHGTEGDSNEVYQKLQRVFAELTEKKVIVTTMQQIAEEELSQKIQSEKVILAPLLLTAGRHVEHELAGCQPESCKSLLEKAGYLVNVINKGLGEYPQVRKLYVEQLAELYQKI